MRPAGSAKVARGPGRRTLLRRLWEPSSTKPAGGTTLEHCPRGRSSPVCSVRRQLPGRRTSVFRRDRPRVRERAEAGSRVASRNSGMAGVRAAASPSGSESCQTMCLKIQPRPGCSPGTCAPEGRDRVAVGFSQLKLSSSTTGNHCLLRILSGDRNLPDDRSCLIAEVDFIPQASPHYGGLPILATTNRRRKPREISLAHSPIFQRVRPCWGFP